MWFVRSKMSFLNPLFFPGWLFGQMPGVLQESGDGDSNAWIRSQVKLNYFIIRVSHLYQECHVLCIFIRNDWGDEIGGGLLIFRAFVFCSVMFAVSLFRWLEHDGHCFCFFFFFFLYYRCLFPLRIYSKVFQHVSLKLKFSQKYFPNHGGIYIIW